VPIIFIVPLHYHKFFRKQISFVLVQPVTSCLLARINTATELNWHNSRVDLLSRAFLSWGGTRRGLNIFMGDEWAAKETHMNTLDELS